MAKAKQRDPHEQWVMDHAEHYTACVFRGAGRYDTTEHATLDEARAAARAVATDRGVMIYAVFGIHQGHIETIFPNNHRRHQ